MQGSFVTRAELKALKSTIPGILFAPQNGVWPAAKPWTPAYPRIPAKDILGYP